MDYRLQYLVMIDRLHSLDFLNIFNLLINLPEISPHIRPHNIDHTRCFCHVPARLRVDANMFGLACGYAAVCRLVPLRSADGARRAGVGLG